MTRLMSALFLAASLAAPAAAQTVAPPPVATPAPPPVVTPPKEKLICRREPLIGSLIRQPKTCKTAAQWSSTNEAARREVEDMQRPGASSGN